MLKWIKEVNLSIIKTLTYNLKSNLSDFFIRNQLVWIQLQGGKVNCLMALEGGKFKIGALFLIKLKNQKRIRRTRYIFWPLLVFLTIFIRDCAHFREICYILDSSYLKNCNLHNFLYLAWLCKIIIFVFLKQN